MVPHASTLFICFQDIFVQQICKTAILIFAQPFQICALLLTSVCLFYLWAKFACFASNVLHQTHLHSMTGLTSSCSAWGTSLSNPPASLLSCPVCWFSICGPWGRHFPFLAGVLTPLLALSGALGWGTMLFTAQRGLCAKSQHSMAGWAREQPAAHSHTHASTVAHKHTHTITWLSQGAGRDVYHATITTPGRIESHGQRDKQTLSSKTLATISCQWFQTVITDQDMSSYGFDDVTEQTPMKSMAGSPWQDMTAFSRVNFTVSWTHLGTCPQAKEAM